MYVRFNHGAVIELANGSELVIRKGAEYPIIGRFTDHRQNDMIVVRIKPNTNPVSIIVDMSIQIEEGVPNA